MPVGFETYDSAGRLQITSNVMNYVLHSSGTGTTQTPVAGNTTSSTALVPIAGTSSNRLVAIQTKNYSAGLMGNYTYNGTVMTHFATSGFVGSPFRYFVFDQANQVPSVNFGIEIYNESGLVTFNTNYRVMQCVGMVDIGEDGNEFGGFYNQLDSFSLPGRDLAYAQAGFGGHRLNGAYECWDGGTVSTDPPGGICNDWRMHNDAKVYGAQSNNAGDTVTADFVSWDDVLLSGVDPNNPEPEWKTPTRLFIIDVTGI